MNIKIIAAGKAKEKYLVQGINDYLKRLKPHARVEIIEVPEEKILEKASPAEKNAAIKKEGEKILKKLDGQSYCIVLAIEGQLFSSEDLARSLDRLGQEGKKKITFIIGGPLGLSVDVKKKAHLLLSFSPMTFPHQLTRLILLEQIYRALKINRGEPYHK